MSDPPRTNQLPGSGDQSRTADEVTKALRLRAGRPRVTRLSRKALAGAAAIVLVLLSAVILWSLQRSGPEEDQQEELYSTEGHPTAEGLGTLPVDYSGLPRDVPPLGPPLPGDLGRPILAAQGNPPTADPEEERRAQEIEAALASRLFAQTTTGQHLAGGTALHPAADTAAIGTRFDGASAPTDQDRKLMFVNAVVDRRTTSADRLQPPPSPFVLQAGAVIPAALITGIRSDLPGEITAQVTENVYDTPTGRYLLIPQGARLIGAYDSSVAFGQRRVLLVWTRLILPDGSSIVIERQQGVDPQGYSGLEDKVDYHWWDLAKAAALSTLLNVGAELAVNDQDPLLRALQGGAQGTVTDTGQQIVRRQLDVQPTLTIRPGFPVRVIVNRDLVLEPYRG